MSKKINNKICFYCGEKFDINSEEFVKPNKVRYAHSKCHDDFINKREDVKMPTSPVSADSKICFYCKEPFELKGNNYRMPRINRYAHKECYEKLYTEDEEWIDQIYTFLTSKGFKYNYQMCEHQRNKLVRENGFTNKGIFLTLKYFYEIKKGDFKKANGGIGIVPFIYEEAGLHYAALLRRQKRLEAAVQEPSKVREVTITQEAKEKKKVKYSLEP